MVITLVFADALIAPASGADALLADAQRLFGRFSLRRREESAALVDLEMPWERYLRERFGVPHGASVEAASAHLDGVGLPSWRVTPVNLHAGRDHLVLSVPRRLQISAAQAEALAASVAPLLGDHGMRFEIPSPNRWYLVPERNSLPPWRFAGGSASVAAGRNIDAYNPNGPDARPWRRLLNEIQMTWHDHPVNRERAERGEPAINSLWFDGAPPPTAPLAFPSAAGTASGSPAPDTLSSPRLDPNRSLPDAIITDLDCLGGLARSIGLTASSPTQPMSSARLFRAASADIRTSPRELLVMLDPAASPSDCGDGPGLWARIGAQLGRVLQPGRTPVEGLADASWPRASLIRVVLTGERKLVELESQPLDRWKFWRRLGARDWFEWSDRDH